MEKKQKIIQIYAVIISVIAVITILISLSTLISSYIDKSDPLSVEIYSNKNQASLASFENFKMDILKSTQKDQAYIPDDKTIQKMYDEAKAAKIKVVEHRANSGITVSAIIMIIAVILFGSHIWLMKRTKHVEVQK
jgi:predicted PurR-regulated permease PerM